MHDHLFNKLVRFSPTSNSIKLLVDISAKVLKFLFEKQISHMDLKPENILLTSIERPVLKVAGK